MTAISEKFQRDSKAQRDRLLLTTGTREPDRPPVLAGFCSELGDPRRAVTFDTRIQCSASLPSC